MQCSCVPYACVHCACVHSDVLCDVCCAFMLCAHLPAPGVHSTADRGVVAMLICCSQWARDILQG